MSIWKVFFPVLALGLLVFPSVNYGLTEPAVSGIPPIEQPLMREGELAVRLTDVLNLGGSRSEPEAERILSKRGIFPTNGWIADYPVTPATIGELRSSVVEAADLKQIPMTRTEALNTFDALVSDFGLDTTIFESGEQLSNGEPPADYPHYVPPAVVNNYYLNYGPPLITYYLPPPSYYYLYSWVPYPFGIPDSISAASLF